jgi:hypothetical protein
VAGARLRTTELPYYLRSRWYPSQYVIRTPNPETDPAGFFAESHGGRFWNVGAATERLVQWKSLSFGGEIEMWRQPSFGTGAGVHTWVTVGGGVLRGLRLYGGYKADGDWPGRPANPGAFLRVGYRFQ